MKKFLVSVITAASAFAVIAPVQAATLTPQFDVNINLTTACKISTAPTAVTFNYTALQTGASSLAAAGSYGVTCTKNLTYTMALDLAGSYTDQATDLAYTLALSSAGTAGSGIEQTYSITGNMAAGQSGTCAVSAASCTNAASLNKTRTLTVTY